MKFHPFFALGWNHCSSIRFLGLPEDAKSWNFRKIVNSIKRNSRFSENSDFLWNLMKFKKIMDFHDFGLKSSAKRLWFTLFTARGENDDFYMIFSKNTKNNWKQSENRNWKHKNHRKSDFSIQHAHAGAGKSVFISFYEKVGNSLNFTNFIKFH